ncbi:MAG: DNA polymerase/3'-5' exonuclease PolX [Bacteroidota bacterium]
MPVHNKEIGNMLNQVADFLEIKGENQFRVRSYRTAAQTISGMGQNITQLAGKKDIKELPDIGESMAEKIEEIADTGKLKQLEELKKDLPDSLIQIMKLEQLGPQRTKKLYQELGIESISELKQAAQNGEIEKLDGFGKKTAHKILEEIKDFKEKSGSERIKLNEAEEITKPLVEYLQKEINNITVAGSYRRRKETVGDIDIIGTAKDSSKAMEHFVNFDEVEEVISKGDTRSTIKLRTGLHVDIRIVSEKSFGAAKLYLTGSKAHSIALRKISREKNYKLNEYGIFEGKKQLAGKTEKQMYNTLDLDYIEPELREDNGEIEAAKNNKLPALVEIKHIKGDLHTHTNATDGKSSLQEMANAAHDRGYSYFAVTDHSKKVSMAHGLDAKRLEQQIKEIDELNSKFKNMKIIKSIEVDILEDGTLDLPDSILKELDMVVASIHYNRNLPEKKQTRRVLKAMENPYFNILGHPGGRLIGKRKPYDIQMETILKEAKNNGCFLEINSNPERLDLSDEYIRQAKESGLKLVISTDAHSPNNLQYIKYGVAQARRGWMEKDDIINTKSWTKLKKLLKRN